MVVLWIFAVLFIIAGLSGEEPVITGIGLFIAFILSAIIYLKRRKPEIPVPVFRPPASIPRPISDPTPLPEMEPFTCKSCGASNSGGFSLVCDFCGAAAPVAKKTPPPVPAAASSAVASPADESIGVSSVGWVCRSCSTYSSIPNTEMPGSLVLEVILWFFYILPGVFYTMWRRSDKNAVKVCGMCQSNDFVPVSSPEGRSMFQRKYGRRPRFD